MAKEFDFGEAILDIKTDRSQLTSGLKQAQIQTTNASSQMSKSLDKATGSTQATTASLLLLDKAAVASGSSSLAYTRVLVELTLATGGLKEVTKAATAAMVGLRTATLATSVPFAAVIAAVLIAIALVAALFNVRKIADWTTGLKGAREELGKIKDKLKESNDARKKQMDAAKERIRLLQGGAARGTGSTELDNLIKRGNQIERINKMRDAGIAQRKAENKATVDRISALRTEMGLLTGQIKPVDLLKTLQEKILFTKNESLRVAKQESLEAKARAAFTEDAYQSRRKELGLVVRGKTSVLSELRSAAATQLGARLRQAQQVKAIQHLPPELQGIAKQMLGVSAGQGGGGVGGSPAALGGVRQALSAGGVAFGGRKELDVSKLSLKQLEKMTGFLEDIVAQEKGLGAFEEN